MKNTTLKTRRFYITGLKPYYNKAVNDFIAACDLGTDGGFVKLSEIATITLSPNVTQEQLDKHPDAIKQTYEQLGCINISISELE